MTLVALLAVTTGAWAADVLNIVVDGTSATIKYDGNANNNPILGETDWVQSGYDWDEELTIRPTITTVTIDGSCKNFSGSSLHGLFFGFSGLTTINGLDNLNTANVRDMENMFAGCSSLTSLDLSSFNTASVTTMFCMFDGCSKLTSLDLSSWNTEKVATISGLFNDCSELTTVDLSSWNTAKVWNTSYMFYGCSKLENIYVGDGWSTAAVTSGDDMFTGCTKLLSMNTANPATNKTNAHTGDGGYLKVKPAAASGPEVAWDKAKKTGSFTMPGGNVTLEPEYYPQAALTAAPTAINDVPATTDGAIVNAGTVANIGSTENAQGTVMYYVSQSALDDAALLALAADQWTADVPTAKSLAQGQAHVYYYVRGNDSDTDEENFSDGDIKAANALTVNIAAEPTYAVTFAEGTDPNEWSADPNASVKKGQTVTVTYTGTKKVIGVKAEKKAAAAAAEGHALSASAVGEIVGSDGKAYAVADKDNLPSGVTAVAMVAYKSGSNGLAIQLNGSPVEKEWDEAKTYAEGLSAVTGGTWRLPSMEDWQNMFLGCAVSGDATSASDTMNPIAGFKAKIAATGITWKSFYYWSSTEHVMGAWSVLVSLDDSNAAAYFDFHSTSSELPVLGCLAF